MFGLLMVLVILLSGMVLVSETRTYDGEFVVRIVGGPQTAKMISEEMGFHYKGPVSIIQEKISKADLKGS